MRSEAPDQEAHPDTGPPFVSHQRLSTLHASTKLTMIRLLNAKSYTFTNEEDLRHQQRPPYVIISHAWGEQEVIYDDMADFQKMKASKSWKKADSAAKVTGACKKVLECFNGEIKHIWLDTVCINKKDPAEVSTSINSMYQWYKKADVCFAYLYDYPSKEVAEFTGSKWFTRGWTLQELVAPKRMKFFDKDWELVGDKESLQSALTSQTKISRNFLLQYDSISRASISQRMSWFSERETTVPEDTAYCLLGLFGVNMPLLYGEGKERAFRRLQEEIMKYSDDHSLFAWKHQVAQKDGSGLLAGSPDCFKETGAYVHKPGRDNNKPFQMTNKGISIDLYLQRDQNDYVASIDCLHGNNHYLGMYLECLSSETQQYRRTKTDEICKVIYDGRGQLKRIYVKAPDEI